MDVRVEKRGKNEDDSSFRPRSLRVRRKALFLCKAERLQKIISSFKFQAKKDNVIGLQLAEVGAHPSVRHLTSAKRTSYIPFDGIKGNMYRDRKGNF